MSLKSKIKLGYLEFLIPFFLLFVGCKSNVTLNDRIIIGISSDVKTINPLYAFDINEGNITDLLFLSLVKHEWDTVSSTLTTEGMLAKSWEWSKDSTSVTFHLRNDAKWSDGEKVTTADVVFSFDAYSDPRVQSRLYGMFQNFYTDSLNHINVAKTFEIISPFDFKINFLPKTVPSIYDVDFTIIPKHVFEKIPRKDFETAEANYNPITCGAFSLEKWNREQSIILKSDPNSFLYNPNNVSEIVFKIIPSYASMLLQLRHGEINLLTDLEPDDVPLIEKDKSLKIVLTKGRQYDYIGWNNIDPKAYRKNKSTVANKLLGNPVVRKALTYAIDRKRIIESYLKGYGQIASGPVSPIFHNAISNNLIPYNYDPQKAKELLAKAGWVDKNSDGILEKDKSKFSFTLYLAPGNPFRKVVAEIVKNDLKSIGINVDIETMEIGKFIESLYAKSLDAWISGWSIAIPLDLKNFWYSSLEQTPSNLVSYINPSADVLMEKMQGRLSANKLNELYKEFQQTIHDDEPVTFLYWIDNITACNVHLKNINASPLGVMHNCWQWSIE